MKRVFAFTLLLFLICSFSKKVYPYDRWKKEDLEKANTAKDVSWLTEEEKQVIYYLNLARINPKLFALTYSQNYLDTAGLKSSYTRSLQNELRRIKPMNVLLPDSALTKSAVDHAASSGKLGTTGHNGKNKRFADVKGRFTLWGENCSYGYDQSLSIVMQLLIDEDHPGLGHRQNILNQNFTHLGTAIRPHQKYTWNCVQNFGGPASK
jgi:uncharacterized protein YkwD